jgi:putative transposase
MPDHLHALISFPALEKMSGVVGDWKRFQQRESAVRWQEGYFDHRIRNDREFEEKAAYIRRNPVVKGLCAQPGD